MENSVNNDLPEGNAINFIKDVLIDDIGRLITARTIDDGHFHYFAFSSICQGIEFLGGLIDKKKHGKSGESEKRFENAIEHFFIKRNKDFYRQRRKFLFKELRGYLIHQFRPSS